MEEHIAALEHALEMAREFIEGFSDVIDGDCGMTEPNRAMQIVSEIDRVLG